MSKVSVSNCLRACLTLLAFVALSSCNGDEKLSVGSGRGAVGSGPDASVVDGGGSDAPAGSELCPSGANIILGTSGNDYLEGTSGVDCILGLGGDDDLYGKGGNDVVVGGSGNDYIHGGGGADSLYGNDGNDTLDGASGGDSLYGGAGDDSLVGRNGIDLLDGGEGNDFLEGSGGDTLLGGPDCDVLDGSDGNNSLDGGDGNDVLQGGYSPTLALGGAGDDFIATCLSSPSGIVDGGAGSDQCDGDACEVAQPAGCDPWNSGGCSAGEERVSGICVPLDRCTVSSGGGVDAGVIDAGVIDAGLADGPTADAGSNGDISLCPSGSNIIVGTAADEYIEGTSGDDCILGLGGNDDLYGLGGNDVVIGGAGDDNVNGNGGNDVLYGGDGNDILDGAGGDDTIYGDAGDDHINGRAGTDYLDGGAGDDWVVGEGNSDTLLGGPDCDVLDGSDGTHIFDGGPGNDVIQAGYSPTSVLGGGGDDFIATCLSDPTGVVDGGAGNDECSGANCEVAPPVGCDPWNTGSCPAGQVRLVGICVPTDRCGAGTCTISDPAGDSTCDGVDDDCDTFFDEDVAATATSCGVGQCSSTGTSSCVNGALSDDCTEGTPAANDATCDGLDDDCDSSVDENFSGAATSCGVGACEAQGNNVCSGGAEVDSCTPGTPAPSDASCDGIDDDCSGTADEDFVGQGTSCGIGVCAATGTSTCSAGVTGDTCTPSSATGADNDCNGLDDDCDGLVDEGFVGTATSCGLGQCAAVGSTICTAGSVVDTCTAGVAAADDATCDGLDNDCDGTNDEDYVSLATSCGVGACADSGLTSCDSGVVSDSCAEGIPAASDSTCDGLDDDCDGQNDEDYAPTSSLCGVGACEASGASSCAGGVEADSCSPGTPAADDATCDGLDDDCDSLIDEDTATTATTCGVGECAETGTDSCIDGQYFDSCRPGLAATIDDSDDGLDNDCDGVADDDVCAPTTCAELGATCGRIYSCGTFEACGNCSGSQNICGTDYTCTSEMTVRAGLDREAVWGQPLLFGRDQWEFAVGGANSSDQSLRIDCEWDFGDGTPVETVQWCTALLRRRPSHTFANPGSYTVTVTATGVASSVAGLVATDTLTVDVLHRPTAFVLGQPVATAIPGEFEVNASVLDAYDGEGALAFEPVEFSHSVTTESATTDANGLASANFALPVGQEITLSGTFAGNSHYLPVEGEAQFFATADDNIEPIGEPGIASEGRHFVLAFPQNAANEDLNEDLHDDKQKQQGLYLHLSSRVSTVATISSAAIGFERTVPVSPGQVMTVKIPEELRLGFTPSGVRTSASGIIQPRTIEVESDAPIAVHALDQIYFTTDGYLGLPVEELGTEYMVLAYPNEKVSGSDNSGGTQLVIAATTDNTVVTVTPSVEVSPGTDLPTGMPANLPSTVTLQRGETLMLANQGTSDDQTVWEDLTGTSIVSNEKVAVFAGHACTNINTTACDHLIEQLPPVTSLGRRFLTVPLATRHSGDVFRVVATVDGTVVRIDGEHLATLARGEVKYFEGLEYQYRVVEATEPVLLAQYAKSKNYNGTLGTKEPADPFMALVPPQGQYPSSYRLTTPSVLKSLAESQSHFLNLTVRADAARGVRINGREISAQWNAIGASGWVGANMKVPDGPLFVDHVRGDEPIGLMTYGFANFDSYGFPGGWGANRRACERTRQTQGDGVDNDCDGRSDEEQANGLDDDGDGFIDEDTEHSALPLQNLAPVADSAFFSIRRGGGVGDRGIVRNFHLPGYDPNDDAISFEIVTQPTSGDATITGRILNFTPPNATNALTITMTVRAFDGDLYSEPVEVEIRIYNNPWNFCGTMAACANHWPLVGWGPQQQIRLLDGEAEREVTGKFWALDVNRDPIRFSVITGPSGLALTDDGAWSYTATRDDADLFHHSGLNLDYGYLEARIQVWENEIPVFASTRRLALIWSDDSDRTPIFVSEPVDSVFAGSTYSYTAEAIDPENQPLTYTMDAGPPWLTMNASSGVLSGTVPSDVGEHPITITATDVGGGATSQDFSLTVYRFGPTIISSALAVGTEDRLYRHQPTAVHDGSATPLAWELILAPAGMTIDVSSGEVEWTPPLGSVGPHDVRFEVVDTAGLRDGQTFTIVVNDQSSAPTITSTPTLHVHADDYYIYQVSATDPDPGDVLTYELTEAPAGMSIGQGSGLIQWLPTSADGGIHAVEVTVYDAALNTDVQQFAVEVEPDYIAPRITLSASPASVGVGDTTTLSVSLEGSYDASTLALMIDGVAVALDTNLQANYTAASSGAHLAIATVTDATGNTGSSSVAIAVTDASDTTGPVAELTVLDDAEFTYLHDVTGTASDANLLHYTLSLRPTADSDFSEFYRGYNSVTTGVLGDLDVTLMENGYYELRLEVTDVNGLTATDSRRVRINGAAKVGLVQLSFVDMAIEMAGIPLTVIRTYDSRIKREGDFGYGWNLDIRAGRVSHSRPIGEGFAVYSGTDFLEQPCLRQHEQDSHFTEVRLSPTEWYVFKPVAVGMHAISGTCAGQISYELVDGSREGAELVILGDNSFFARPQTPTNNLSQLIYGQLTDGDTGTINFDPQDVRLSTADGRTFDLNTKLGIFFVEDSNGNSVAYEDTFIAHSDGRSIDINRDQDGRVTTITDPMGNAVQYQYDDKGDLVGVVDLLGTFTEFLYEAPVAHHLTSIIDPKGNRIAAMDYDDDGRLAASCDANDDCTRMTYDLVGQSQTIEDPTRVQSSHTYDNYGNITSTTDGLGNTTTFVGGLYPEEITDPLGNTTEYTYHISGKVLSRTDPHSATDDPNDHTIRNEYGAHPLYLLTKSTNKAGASIHREYDPGGNLTEIRDDAGNVIQSMTRSIWGKLQSKTDRFGTKTYQYTSGVSQPTRVVDGHGVETIFAYDDSNRLIRMIRGGLTARFTYDSAGRELRRDYGNGVTADFGYSVGVPEWTRISGPTFGTVTRSFSKTGRLVGWTKPNGDTFSREFDGAGRLATMTNALGNRILYQYDGAGNLETTTREEDGAATTNTRDAAGNTLATTNPGGFIASNQWADGELIGRTDVRGFTTTFDNTPTSYASTDALGRATTQNLSPYGLATSLDLPGGSQTTTAFDGTTSVDQADDFPLSAADESGRARALTYASGQLATATTQGGTSDWSFTYEDAPASDIGFSVESGEVWLAGAASEPSPLHQGATDASIGNAEFDSQDWSRRLSSMTSPVGDITSWAYNAAGQLASMTYPDATVAEFDYETSGEVTQQRQPNGTQLDFTYDNAGNEVTRTASTGETRSYTYGANNRIETATNGSGIVTRNFDSLGRLSRVDTAQGGSVSYTYDLLGRTTSVTVEVGVSQQTTTYTHDAAGNIATVVDPLGGLTSFTYNAVSRLTARTLPNGMSSTWTYDMRDRVLSVEHRHLSGAVLASRGYARAPSGEPTRVTSEDGSYVSLQYDSSLRITNESYFTVADVPLNSISYIYDLDGNRTSKTIGGISEDYQYSPGAKLDSIDVGGVPKDVLVHDANGRTTSIYRDGVALDLAFDVDDNVTALSDASGTIAQYGFDAFGGRDKVTSGTSARSFVVAPAMGTRYLSNHAVLDDVGGLLVTYVYAGEHPLMRIDSVGVVTYYLQDPQGSTIGLGDVAGELSASFTYDSFGNERSAAGSGAALPGDSLGDFRFQGMWLDDSGLYFVRARSYDARTGRFLSRDPWNGETIVPETLTPYCIDQANPRVWRDPTGRTSSLVEISSALRIRFVRAGKLQQRVALLLTSGVGNRIANSKIPIDSYYAVRNSIRLLNPRVTREAHHILEKRFHSVLRHLPGYETVGRYASVALSRADHRLFTNLWRAAIPYGSNFTLRDVVLWGRTIYANHPKLLEQVEIVAKAAGIK